LLSKDIPQVGPLQWGCISSGGQLRTFSFEALLFFALFSIVSIRERRAWWTSRPSKALSIALFADACAGVAVAVFGLGELDPLPPLEMAFIVASALFFSLIVNDFFKTAFITRYWNATRLVQIPTPR
jgi:H+-transporting ATPase